jgi:hypothetical protein
MFAACLANRKYGRRSFRKVRYDDERAWVRLKGRREFEHEQETAPPPPPPEDYGIIEWDKEKCWW